MCLAAGIVPLQGQWQALEALDLAAGVGEAWARGAHVELRLSGCGGDSHAAVPVDPNGSPLPGRPRHADGATNGRSLAEHEGKAALAAFGVQIPKARLVKPSEAADAAAEIGFPVVIKVASAALEHKSDVGGVVVDIRNRDDARAAAERLARLAGTLLVEEMVGDSVAEILIGVTVDPQFGQVLVLGAGGVLTELLRDTVSLLPPFTSAAIEAALKRLTAYQLLTGYRGRPRGDVTALIETALACARYAEENVDTLLELDINPVIVRSAGRGAVAVDALVRLID